MVSGPEGLFTVILKRSSRLGDVTWTEPHRRAIRRVMALSELHGAEIDSRGHDNVYIVHAERYYGSECYCYGGSDGI